MRLLSEVCPACGADGGCEQVLKLGEEAGAAKAERDRCKRELDEVKGALREAEKLQVSQLRPFFKPKEVLTSACGGSRQNWRMNVKI